MHEMGICQGILDVVHRGGREARARRASRRSASTSVSSPRSSSIALQFAFESLTPGHAWPRARRSSSITSRPRSRCSQCGTRVRARTLRCHLPGVRESVQRDIRARAEIDSIEVDDDGAIMRRADRCTSPMPPRRATPSEHPTEDHGDRYLKAHPRPQRAACGREPSALRREGRLRPRPHGEPGRGQDLHDPRDDRRAARPVLHRGHRGRHRQQGRRREDQRRTASPPCRSTPAARAISNPT